MYFDTNGKNFANSVALKNAMVRGKLLPNSANVYSFPDGRQIAVPLDANNSGTQQGTRGPLLSTQPTPSPNTGPYRRILTPPGYAYIQGDVNMPCRQSNYAPGDGGYAMFGGFGANGAAADAGLEDYAGSPGNEAIFIKESSSNQYANGYYTVTDPFGNDKNHTGISAHLQCGQSIALFFYANPDGYLNVEGDGAVTDGSSESVIATLGPISSSQWPESGGGSNGIILKRFVGIAQPLGDDFNDGSYLGVDGSGNPTVHWQDTLIGHAGGFGGVVNWDGAISGTAYQIYPACSSQYNIVRYLADGGLAKSYAEYEGIDANAPVKTC